jgi:pimeloyl-ACP methyl ester carboxylesterase
MSTSLTSITHLPTRLGSLQARIVGDGRTTILWSSMFVDSTTWDRMLPLLVRGTSEPRRFVLIDPPGLGASEPLRRASTILGAADAARDAIAALEPEGPVDWLGNAFGGHVGFELARDATLLRSLVAVSSPVEAIAPALRRKILLLAPLLRIAGPVGPVRDAIVAAMLTEASAADPGTLDTVLASLRRPTRTSMGLALRSFILDRVDVSDRIPDIAVPSLFVASDDRGDWSPGDAARSAATVPSAQVATIARARTLVPLEQPDALAGLVLRFWAGLPRDE